ncbi:SRPBCC family protein [Mucilaginibacter sp. BT774]|uniref:SRPBCC family protein n=1 Tax=Mucilaginibacter sp. BT774 TaxID=3062276 RepID=UPI0026747202|nr:SRPBCC family protein [Mucilaginibacter sp. BT774]MDO3627667.1 SRPBCC family protein [Mucilaginibacter sp. BT774]
MTIFESKTNINKSVNEVYQFLADMNNHQQLMPENIVNWTSTPDEARFDIQNMGKLALKIDRRMENTEINIIPSEKPPFDLQLNWKLADAGTHTEVLLTIAADLNMMMKMLASGPLQKLTDHEVQSLAEVLG